MEERMKFRKCVCVMLVFFIHLSSHKGVNGEFPSLNDITEVLNLGAKVASEIAKSWELFATGEIRTPSDISDRYQPRDNGGEIYYPMLGENQRKLMNKISTLYERIELFEANSNIRTAAMFQNMLQKFHEQTLLSDHLRILNNHIRQISSKYRTFENYANKADRYEVFTLREFVKWCVSPNTGIPDTLEELHSLIISNGDGFADQNLIQLLSFKLREGSTAMCNDQQSPQQLLYNLYNSIAVTEIKGYAMIQFSFMLLRLYKQGNFIEESQLTKNRYETRMSETLKAVQTAMAVASQDVWKCDPSRHIASQTYTELTWFLQSYIVNEVDLNSDNTCRENCAYYQYARVQGCFKNQYCARQRKCNGKIYNCQYIDSDMWICPAERNSPRRYESIEYESGQILGQKGSCSRGTTKVDSWWRWLFWHCSYCLCYCDDHSSDSDRYFNLREVVADVASNKVITGIRFVKVNRVIHLQIEQGTLLERGRIANTTEWKPVDSYSINYDVKNGKDYLTLSWENRAVDLDDLIAKPGHLLTGVRFRSLGSHVNLEIMSTPFNFTTGRLSKPLEKSIWHGNDNTDVSHWKPRKKLELTTPDRSDRSEQESIPDSKSDQFVVFTPTDLNKDAGQSTVPFIDMQPVLPYPRIPIAGAGIYHKGRPGFGGYIAPKLKTYNFSPHLYINHSHAQPVVESGEDLIALPMN